MNYKIFLASSLASACLVGAIGYAHYSNAASQPHLLGQNSSPDSEPTQPFQMRPKRRHRRIDFAAAATQLGTTEAQLKQLLGVPERPDLAEVASNLGVTGTQLREALGIALDPETGEPTRPRTRPDLAAAATQLGVTETELKEALGFPGRDRPRLDIAGTAAALGVTEAQVIEALGLPVLPAGQ